MTSLFCSLSKKKKVKVINFLLLKERLRSIITLAFFKEKSWSSFFCFLKEKETSPFAFTKKKKRDHPHSAFLWRSRSSLFTFSTKKVISHHFAFLKKEKKIKVITGLLSIKKRVKVITFLHSPKKGHHFSWGQNWV